MLKMVSRGLVLSLGATSVSTSASLGRIGVALAKPVTPRKSTHGCGRSGPQNPHRSR
jgi:hypothetical protein